MRIVEQHFRGNHKSAALIFGALAATIILAASPPATAVQITNTLGGVVTTNVSADIHQEYGSVAEDFNRASTNGSIITGKFVSGDKGSFTVDPMSGLGLLENVSQPVNFGAQPPFLVSSQAGADLRIAPRIVFTGTLPTIGTGILTVHYGGLLEPNPIYEENADNFAKAHGNPNEHFNTATVTAGATLFSAGPTAQATQIYHSGGCAGTPNCTTSLDMTGKFDLPFEVTPGHTMISLDFQMQGSGYDGGGFTFDPYFTIAFTDPHVGIAYSGTSGFFKTVAATPLPSTLLLFLSALIGFTGLGVYRRVSAGSGAGLAA